MKKIQKIIALIFLTIIYLTSHSQTQGPPDPPGSHGNSGDQQPGGGASLQDGMLILLVLASGYAIKRR
ncbi:MAG: hypothetical protein P8100_05260, partial [bacterium]